MDYIWMIVKRDLKSLVTPSGKSTLKGRLGFAAAILVWVALTAALGYGAFRLFNFMSASLGFSPDLRAAVEINILNASAMLVLAMVLLTGLQTTYKTIYESDDVGFLLSQPVPEWSVFGAKYAISYAALFALTVGYGLPVWIAFGYVRGLGAGFYLLTVLGFLLLLLASHAAVTLLLLAAMRYLPGRKMKQLFVALSAIVGIVFVLVTQILSARMARSSDPMKMIEELGKGRLSRQWYLPTAWMANGILSAVPEFGIEGTGGWLALLAAALGGPYLAMVLSKRWYLHGWSGRADELRPRKVRKKRAAEAAVPEKRLQGPFWSILRKDLKVLWRDPVVWYTLAVGAIGLGFFVYNIGSAAGQASSAPDAEDTVVASAMMVAMPALMGAISSAQTGGVSLSREGKAFWLLRSAPVSARQLILAKFGYALLPQGLFVLAFDVFLEFTRLPHYPLPLNLAVGGFAVIGVASLQMLLDVYFPDFTLKVELGAGSGSRGTAKLLTSVFGSMGTVAVLGVALSSPVFLRRMSIFSRVSVETLSLWSYFAVGVIGLGLAAVLFGPGARRLSRILSDM